MTIFRRVLTSTAFAALAASPAMATTILTATQTQSSGLQQANDSATGFTFAKFNSALGLLTSVHLTLNGFEETGYTVTDNSASPNTYTFTNNVSVILSNGVSPFITVLPTASATGTLTAGGTATSPGYPARTLTNSVQSADTVFTDSTTLSQFNGPGSVFLFTSAHSTNGFSAAGDVSSTVSTRYQSTITLQYDYFVPDSGTPEPATMALMGSALLGLGLLRRRTKKQ